MNHDAANSSIMSLVKPDMKVCEIGIAEGISSLNFLEADCFLYMIDPWEPYDEYTETAYKHEEDYEKTLDKVKNFGRYQIIRKKSDDALDDVPNDLDLVYIDGNHAYAFVKNDMKNYWRKLKSGGWLTGDDFSMQGVMHAVVEVWYELKQENSEIKLEIFGRNWAIQKP